jgi:hypothetical protein
MNSSAKVAALSCLAAWALGIAVFSACTVTSGTVDNTDGGFQPPATPSDSTGTSGSVPVDQPDGSTPATCNSGQDGGVILNANCQACLNAKCCTQLTNCFAITGLVGCQDYITCVNNCAVGDNSCLDGCDTATQDSGVVQAYNAISTCGDGPNGPDGKPVPGPDNCAAECSQ